MGTFSILNNISALHSQKQLGVTNASLSQSIARISSGKRINSGADDAAGLMIADTLRANVRALDQAVRNANDCISIGQIADGALQEITNLLTRSVTLAEQAATENRGFRPVAPASTTNSPKSKLKLPASPHRQTSME